MSKIEVHKLNSCFPKKESQWNLNFHLALIPLRVWNRLPHGNDIISHCSFYISSSKWYTIFIIIQNNDLYFLIFGLKSWRPQIKLPFIIITEMCHKYSVGGDVIYEQSYNFIYLRNIFILNGLWICFPKNIFSCLREILANTLSIVRKECHTR